MKRRAEDLGDVSGAGVIAHRLANMAWRAKRRGHTVSLDLTADARSRIAEAV